MNAIFLASVLLFVTFTNGARRHPNDVNRNKHKQQYRDLLSTEGKHRHDKKISSPITTKDMLNDILHHQNRNLKQENTSQILPTPNDHLVRSLPYLNPSDFVTDHYAGHIPASPDDDKAFFYWLFAPDTSSSSSISDDDIPLLIWLNGGPGCSSMDGLFIENGPFRLTHNNEAWSMEINEYSWHKSPAWVLYIDQPVGTGLSFSKQQKLTRNDLEVNIDFHYFLQNLLLVYKDFFLQIHDDSENKKDTRYKLKRPLYFSGESHAGHYIPSMMDYILDRNDDDDENTQPKVIMTPLMGAAIGNGWMDPYHQYGTAQDVAYGRGILDSAQKAHFDQEAYECRAEMDGGTLSSPKCYDIMDDVVYNSFGNVSEYRVCKYDMREVEKNGEYPSFPPGHEDVEVYLGGWPESCGPMYKSMDVDYEDVLKSIHAEQSIEAGQRFEECSDPPFDALCEQDGLGVVDEVVRILNHSSKPRLLFFNGLDDLICNHVGNERFLDNLPWIHKKDWLLSKRYAWVVNDPEDSSSDHFPAGYIKEYDNLSFLKIRNSGHMVPMDQPFTSLEMMRNFMFRNGDFQSSYQSINRLDPNIIHHEETPPDGGGQKQLQCEPCNKTCDGNHDATNKDSATAGSDGEEEEEERYLVASSEISGSSSIIATPPINDPFPSDTSKELNPKNRFLLTRGWVFCGSLMALCALVFVTTMKKKRMGGWINTITDGIVEPVNREEEEERCLELCASKINIFDFQSQG